MSDNYSNMPDQYTFEIYENNFNKLIKKVNLQNKYLFIAHYRTNGTDHYYTDGASIGSISVIRLTEIIEDNSQITYIYYTWPNGNLLSRTDPEIDKWKSMIEKWISTITA